MAAVASSSRPRKQKHSARPTSDVFRSKFPLDPHASLSASGREPWFLKPDRLPSLASHPRRDVILVLGAPSTDELNPLLLSKYLANSLLIIATHVPPEIPHTTLPAVRVLQLKGPLAIEDAGAVRFVNVLEWAERVARLWRKHGGFGAVQLAEEDDGQEYLTPPTLFSFSGSQSTPVSPRSSTSALSISTNSTSTRPRSVSARLLTLSRSRQSMLPSVDPTQRPFDALLNFLPRDTSDKALLKQSILVTTISRPFLVAADTRPVDPRGKRRSLFSSRSTTSVYLPPTPPYQSGESLNLNLQWPSRAHLMHLLPTETRSFPSYARSRLVQSLETFLLNFAYSSQKGMSLHNDDSLERAHPYIMQASTLGQLVVNTATNDAGPSNSPYGPWNSEYILADLILHGSLDPVDNSCTPGLSNSGLGKSPISPTSRLVPRAWVAGPSDIIMVSDDTHILTSTSPSPNVVVTPPEPAASPSSASGFTRGISRWNVSNGRGIPGGSQSYGQFPPPLSPSATQDQTSYGTPSLVHPQSPSFPNSPQTHRTVLSSSLPSTHSRLGGSPLAPKNSKRGRYNSASAVFDPSDSGLPTPPDSEESVSDLPVVSDSTTGDADVNEHDLSEDFKTQPTAADRCGSVSSKRNSLGTSLGTAADGSDMARRSRKIKWKFWKGSKS
ncbi:hypothetical protein QCA50_010795 [Cerrena zonata]|uniref:Uncharacterized protein n=1 Tax=Cerrena zonata TaxID=2478898 RepID=A0AAW0G499_9APHY